MLGNKQSSLSVAHRLKNKQEIILITTINTDCGNAMMESKLWIKIFVTYLYIYFILFFFLKV